MDPVVPNNWKYHVFVCFRGEDTRKTFVSHLHYRLATAGIYAFVDADPPENRELTLDMLLLQAIEQSRFSIVVLSQNFASSSWCLEELVKILECRQQTGQIVIPIFYGVDPSDVRRQRGNYGEALEMHEERLRDGMEKVSRWRAALEEVANLSGWTLEGQPSEASLIEHVVRDISDKLVSTSSDDALNLFGIASQVMEMDQLLSLDSSNAKFIGIWGMGGIGKTTIAKVMFDRISEQFEARCFLDNVREQNNERQGPVTLQRELLSQLLLEKELNIGSKQQGSSVIKDRLRHKKVLVVLDDVDSLEQLSCLARELGWFGPGSRIIITTQDKHLLLAHGVDTIYEVKLMDDEVALQLFCWHAFKQNQPIIYLAELSKDFVSYAEGLPLALEVLGSYLSNRSLPEWKSALDRLKNVPHMEIMKVLQPRYNALVDIEKEIFLDIACFFNGEDKDVARNILDACGLHPEVTMSVLSDKALLSFSNRKLSMHRLLREMGREIVRQESIKEPGRWSRLWNPDDICHILTAETGTMQVEVMSLDMSEIDTTSLPSTAFAGMRKLRVLKFYNSRSVGNCCRVQLPKGLQYLPGNLRSLRWDAFPLKSLPLNFSPENLVVISMPYGKIKELWTGKRRVPNLRSIDLSHSSLTRLPDLSDSRILERINLEDCKKLVDVSTIQYLRELEHLYMKGCVKLRSFPSIEGCICLTTLDLSGCLTLKELPELSRSIKYLYLGGTPIRKLPPSVEFLLDLVELDLRNCTSLRHLPESICQLGSLRSLNITGCLNISASELLQNLRDGILQQESDEEVNTSCLTSIHSASINLEIGEWLLLCASTILEGTSAAFEQLKYSLLGMVMAILGLLLCVIELSWKVRKEQAKWKWNGSVPWIYSHRPHHKLFGTTIEYFVLAAAIWQLFYSTLGYLYAREKSQNPIQMTVIMVLFCLSQLIGKLIKECTRAAPQPESSLELVVVQN